MMDPNINLTPEQQLMIEESGSQLVPKKSTVNEPILRKKFLKNYSSTTI